MAEEFDLVKSFRNLLHNWWKIVLLACISALVGLAISYLMPHKYEAEAIFHASLDFTEINFENLQDGSGNPVIFTQYDEDLALQVVERVLLTEKAEAFSFALTLDPALDLPTFQKDYQIQRYQALWYLRYRHADPVIAQAIVNFWAERAAVMLQNAQANGKAEKFVIVGPVADASLPEEPLYQNKNSLVLAGALFGFVIGVLLVDGKHRFSAKPEMGV